MFVINGFKFPQFIHAAAYAFREAIAEGECKVRLENGTLVADFRANFDGTVSVMATDVGRNLVLEAAR